MGVTPCTVFCDAYLAIIAVYSVIMEPLMMGKSIIIFSLCSHSQLENNKESMEWYKA